MGETFFGYFIQHSITIIPWMILGVVFDYLIRKHITPEFLQRHFQKENLSRILTVQLLGMASPLTTMSFLPMARGLARKGVHPGLLLSFLGAERAYGVQSFFILTGIFGIVFAAANFFVVFMALLGAAFALKNDRVMFKARGKGAAPSSFLKRQTKLFILVFLGIGLAAAMQTFIPVDLVARFASGEIQSFVTAMALSFVLYLGTIFGNYPVGKAFLDLGMSPLGVFIFITISPIFNAPIILFFASAIKLRHVVKFTLAYTLLAILLAFLISPLL
jgi:uncharacterized membrane protein YraQ (UPF0718 family)